jgi:pimeloyl-ACP methyl ester carboxylesterase
MKKLGVLVLHGIGTSHEHFDKPFKAKLYKILTEMGKDTQVIAYQKVYWAEYINKRQIQYFDDCRSNPNNDLDWIRTRRFVINNLSDASAYQSKHGQTNTNYNNIIRTIYQAVRLIKTELNADDKPLIVIAHSLGGFIINNYIWDAHKLHAGKAVDWPEGISINGKFENMINVAGMITFGCNIPLFVIGNDPIEAIQFPHPELTDELKGKAQWYNYYDPDDILGWPLRELQYSFDGREKPETVYAYPDVVTKDEPMQVGHLLGWSPLSHMDYWTNRKFVNAVADYISQFM